MNLAGAIAAVQNIVSALPGIKQAPETPPEKMAEFPFAVAYPNTGRDEQQVNGWHIAYHSIVLEIHIARKDLPTDITTALPYAELVPAALNADRTLNGSVTRMEGEISYAFSQLDWVGDVTTIGFRFEFEVRINNPE